MGLVGILIGVAVIIVLIYNQISVIVAAPIGAIIILLFNDVPVFEWMFGKENSYVTALADLVASNFIVFLLGTIFAKYMDKSGATIAIGKKVLAIFGSEKPYYVFVSLFIISAVLSYGGINAILLIFALIPMAKPIFKELDIPWKLAIVPIFGGSATFTMTMLPGAPSFHNIVASTSLGTPLTAAANIGIFVSIISIVFILVLMKYLLHRSTKQGLGFGDSHQIDIVEDDNRVYPTFLQSITPLILLIVLIFAFSKVSNIIIIALSVSIIVSMILFRKQIAQQKKVISDGASEATVSTMTIASTTAFGTVTTNLHAFSNVFSWIQQLPGPPILSLMIGTGLISGVTASSVGAIGIAVNSFVPYYLSSGIDLTLLHRAIVVSSGALTIVPYSGFLLIYNRLSGLTLKDTFLYAFLSVCVTHWIAMAAIILLSVTGVI